MTEIGSFRTGGFAKFAAAGANRHLSNGEHVNRLAGLALKVKPSVDFGGYWQRHISR
jgi:hypothetical protein